MAEVHEITRTAFNQLLRNCADNRDFSGREWVVVETFVFFGERVTPRHLHFYRNIQSESDAQVMAAAAERNNYHDIQDGDPMSECEVWHVVEDEPRTEPIEKVELPKDCNGLYLHVGDAVRECGWQTVYRVNSLRLEREGWLVMYSVTGDNRGLYGRWAKDLIRLDTRVQPTAER